jgi:hypothetical protein
MDLTKGYADDVAYLVRQGQQEVIEEDGGDRGRIILVSIPHQYSQSKMMKNDAHPCCGTEDFGVQRL